jgi:hypothetical protein
MMPSQRIEDVIRNTRVRTSAATDERITAAVEAATAKLNEHRPASVCASGAIRRTIMSSNWTKLATAAAIIVAIGLGMYALTGSFDGTSITMAQVRQAMQGIDWMQVSNKMAEQEGTQSGWFSFASRVEIICDPEGRIVYSDFNTGKKLVWEPGGQEIYESPIDPQRKFIGDIGGPFEFITTLFSFLTAEDGWKVTKELGTYQGRKVEVWSASRVREKADSTRTETATVYIDVDKKLPVGWKEGVKGPDGNIQLLRDGQFKYRETGPADIYEAGAPASAQIKPSPEP